MSGPAAKLDVLFVVDGSSATGFGHVARCLELYRLVRAARGSATAAFQGSFSAPIRARIAAAAPELELAGPAAGRAARVCFVDRMADPDDPEACDRTQLDALRASCDRLVYMASGLTAPILPPGVACVGYQPGEPKAARPGLFWDLCYAPVRESVRRLAGRVGEPGRALVAIGGSADLGPVRWAIRALAREPRVRAVDVLVSPAWAADASAQPSDGATVHWHRAVPAEDLLAHAGLVVASQGNLGYEAMALGRAVVLVGVKDFQATIARRLAADGLAVYGGHWPAATEQALAAAIGATIESAPRLVARQRQRLGDAGLHHVADLLRAMLDEVDVACASSP